MSQRQTLFKTPLLFATFGWIAWGDFIPWADARTIAACMHYHFTLEEVRHDTSIELEYPMSPELMKIVTTTDGTLAPLLKDLTPPQWLASWIKKHHPKLSSPSELSWDHLNHENKLKLLQDVTRLRNTVFLKDRVFHGLRVRDSMTFKFDEPTAFLGRRYPAGYHRIEIGTAFGGRIDYRSPEDVKNVSGLELHLRARVTAGDANKDAREFERAAGLPFVGKHAHKVAPLPLKSLRNDPTTQSLIMANFFERANFLLESLSIFQGRHIYTKKGIPEMVDGVETATLHFASLRPWMIREAALYFDKAGRGIFDPLGDRLKMGWVGFRGHDKYDGPIRLWGLETRRIPRGEDPEISSQILDTLQWHMVNDTYGVDAARMKAWINAQASGKSDLTQALADTWYNQPTESLLAATDRKSPGIIGDELRKFLLDESEDNKRDLKMLLHDWSNDVLVFDQPDLAARIAAEQKRALERLNQSRENSVEVMQDFLWNSGLAQRMADSVGIKLEEAPVGNKGLIAGPRPPSNAKPEIPEQPPLVQAPATNDSTEPASPWRKALRWISSPFKTSN